MMDRNTKLVVMIKDTSTTRAIDTVHNVDLVLSPKRLILR